MTNPLWIAVIFMSGKLKCIFYMDKNQRSLVDDDIVTWVVTGYETLRRYSQSRFLDTHALFLRLNLHRTEKYPLLSHHLFLSLDKGDKVLG